MRLRSPTDLLDAAGMSGTMGGFDPFIEGDDASRRAAHEADMREKRVAAARRKWLEIPAERIETRRMAGKTFVVDTGGSGGVYEYVRVPVWASGDPRSGINDHVPTAFTIVDGDVVFLKDNAIGAKSGADLEQWQNDRAWLAARRQAKAELAAERVEQEHVQFRSKQALKTVTLSDLEGRDLPTVRAAAECIEECGGKLRAKDAGSSCHSRDGSRRGRAITTNSTPSSWIAYVCCTAQARSWSEPSRRALPRISASDSQTRTSVQMGDWSCHDAYIRLGQ